jgi:S-(hydroxymethyl)glutathione dehydrogenase/alcohol dehydrogenase
MKAPVLFQQKEPLRVEELEVEAPRAGEVAVRMVASGVCHSCLHAADGSWHGIPVPIVLGDEGSGIVEAVGPGVQSLKPGDHVILSWAPTCGRCRYCVIGRPNLCENRQPGKGVLPEGTTRLSLAGKPVYQYGHVGTYASRTVVAESSAIPIRPDMPLDRAALIGCSVMTAQVPPGASMAVFGVGGVGLNVIQGGALVTAHPLVAVDVRAERLEQARGLGATHVVDASRQDPVAAIRAITRRGADYTFAAVGDVHAMGQTIDALAPGGTAVLIGVPPTGATLPLNVQPLVSQERVVRGSIYGSARTREDFPRMVELYLAGKLRLDDLITRRYSIDEANEGFRDLASGALARGLIVF